MELPARYINDRFLPDKAIDLMDEAASRVRMEQEKPSEELKSLEEKLNALAKEKEAAVAAQDFEKAARLRDAKKSCQKQLEAERDKRRKSNQEHRDVNAEDIAAVVSGWTGVPVTPPDRGRGAAPAAHGGYPPQACGGSGRGCKSGRPGHPP